MTTLREIAHEAGVHVATASAVLNAASGNTRVSAETRERVLAAAKKLAYVPNESARRLRTGRSNAVGFLGGDLRNPFFAELTAALEGALAQHQLQLMVSHVAHLGAEAVEQTRKALQQQGVRRIISWEEATSPAPSKGKAGEQVLSIGFTNRARPGVWLDLEHAIEVSVAEMIQRGYRRLGFYAPGLKKESPSVEARSAVFAEECVRQKVARPALAYYEGESWDLDAASAGAAAALRANPEVVGWIGFNDISALGLLSKLPIKGAPRVLCFDGTAGTRCWPGEPPRLDLQIAKLAEIVAEVVAGGGSAERYGKRERWLRPSIKG